jgi:hypothetical protein
LGVKIDLRKRINELAEKYLGEWSTKEIHSPKLIDYVPNSSTRIVLTATLATLVFNTGLSKKANAEPLHNNPNAFLIYEERFDGGIWDNWQARDNAGGLTTILYASDDDNEFALQFQQPTSWIFNSNVLFPDIYEIRFDLKKQSDLEQPFDTVIQVGRIGAGNVSASWLGSQDSLGYRLRREYSTGVSNSQRWEGSVPTGNEWDSISLVQTADKLQLYVNSIFLNEIESVPEAGLEGINFYSLSMPGQKVTIDNIEVYGIPEPSTITMLGLGALGLLNRRKDRKYVESKVVEK